MPIIDGITPLIHTQMMGVCREPRLYAFDFQIQATANQTGTIYYTQSIHDSTIEWGDGSVTKIHDASVTASHTYTTAGNYHISVYADRNNVFGLGHGSACVQGVTLKAVDAGMQVKTVASSGFDQCSQLTSASLPGVEALQMNTFLYCNSLINIYLPMVKSCSGKFVFRNCQLTSLWLPKCEQFSDYSPYDLGGLANLYLHEVTNVTVKGNNSFKGSTPSTFNIWVPAHLVNAFKTSSYWSSRADYIFAYQQ